MTGYPVCAEADVFPIGSPVRPAAVADSIESPSGDSEQHDHAQATFALMEGWHQESARTDGPVSLASEREAVDAFSDMYQPLAGDAHEEVAELRLGSWLLTPQGAREDLVILYLHGGGFRVGAVPPKTPSTSSAAERFS
ncbi:hypothetical protein [Streptomyces sp. HD]|uniref:hypothetical protein n=1 Tax=Streptomyces sp. HD TaxID=3020892 RepID=UPI00232FE0E0|nr:hypothetical protein [Streptomyces sp. HD]MDC0770746.1 hypothetical protein [Streptomyces sp. HD]